jgi:hypothetical protein
MGIKGYNIAIPHPQWGGVGKSSITSLLVKDSRIVSFQRYLIGGVFDRYYGENTSIEPFKDFSRSDRGDH